jgi:hypothetical protein
LQFDSSWPFKCRSLFWEIFFKNFSIFQKGPNLNKVIPKPQSKDSKHLKISNTKSGSSTLIFWKCPLDFHTFLFMWKCFHFFAILLNFDPLFGPIPFVSIQFLFIMKTLCYPFYKSIAHSSWVCDNYHVKKHVQNQVDCFFLHFYVHPSSFHWFMFNFLFPINDPLFNVFIFPIESQIVQHVTIPVTPKKNLQFTKNWFGCYNILTWLIIKLS